MTKGLAIGVCVLLAGLCGCGGGDSGSPQAEHPPGTPAAETPAHEKARPAPPERVTPSHCPPGLPSCRTTEGRIVYVERVDPDGDGDAHFVVVDRQGISLPGLTAIDVRRGLRPHPLPGPGELISAAGPVQTGSFGQDQIHAIELHVASNYP